MPSLWSGVIPILACSSVNIRSHISSSCLLAFFPHRADRMVQMSKALEYKEFNVFDRERFPKV